jgi:3-isopropylmalate/(R)-2-methylmalate dehydratase large subunit
VAAPILAALVAGLVLLFAFAPRVSEGQSADPQCVRIYTSVPMNRYASIVHGVQLAIDEAGGKAGIFPYDEITAAYVKDRVKKPFEPVAADDDAVYCQVVKIDLSTLKPVVAFPHLPGNTKRVEDIKEPIAIQQVIIGSCTNGRLEDLQIAAEVFKGHKVADGVRCIVIPGSPAVYKEAMKLGYIDTFIDADCAVSTPTCGPCLGGYMGIMAAGEKCVSTTNRNFRGRMGHVDSEVYLAGPHVAAASAILGRIATAEEVQ